MAENIAEVIPLGPAKVTFNSISLGHTDESGVKLTLKATIVKAQVAKYGKSDVGVFLNGQQAEVDFVIMQSDMTILQLAVPGATIVTNSGGNSKLTFGLTAGFQLVPQTLSITPYLGPTSYGSVTPNIAWTMQAVPMGDFDPVYEGGKVAGYKVKFSGVINESGAASGSWMGSFGDPTITADAVAPTVSGVVPANAATGVATSANVVATLSKAMNGNTVNTETVLLIEDPTGTPLEIAGSVVLVNNGSSTTITFTPTSALASSKAHTFIITTNALGQNGLPITGGFLSHFAT